MWPMHRWTQCSTSAVDRARGGATATPLVEQSAQEGLRTEQLPRREAVLFILEISRQALPPSAQLIDWVRLRYLEHRLCI